MRILVLGGYGLIGSAVVTALLAAGHEPVGFGRSIAQARLRRPQMRWLQQDLKHLVTAQAWTPLLQGIDAVINASGVLQDGPGDEVMVTQCDAMVALFQACEAVGVKRLVQVSAVGASPAAQTVFMRSKGLADEALMASPLDWTILRPGLVLGPQVYGGSALLHALASLPGIILLPSVAPIRTVALDDVAQAALAAVNGCLPDRRVYDIVEEEAHGLDEIVRRLRGALGFPPVPILRGPTFLFRFLFGLGDFAGWLGWRPPVRSTAFRQIEVGIDGDPRPLREMAGRPLHSLAETLSVIDGSARERWFARMFLLKPVIVLALGLFWLISGVIGLVEASRAAAVLTRHGISPAGTALAVYGGALVDILLGIAMLIRRSMSAAALGMIAVTFCYLVAGAIWTPGLWVDPLGPMVKAIPAAVLAAVALAIQDSR